MWQLFAAEQVISNKRSIAEQCNYSYEKIAAKNYFSTT